MEFTEKRLEDHFSEPVMDVLRKMSFTDGKNVRLHGSAMIRSQQYFGDYDGVERVPLRSLSDGAKRFKEIVKRVRADERLRIDDIKCGEIPEWDVMRGARVVDGRIVGVSLPKSKRILERLSWSDRTESELDRIRTPFDVLAAKKLFRDHIVRWTALEILAGEKRLPDGRVYTLEEGMTSGMTKMDTIAIVNGRAMEFSLIYEFEMDGRVLNPLPTDVFTALREDILYYSTTNPFKALKRRFALAKLEGDTETGKMLTPLLNSDLGRLYRLIGAVSTLNKLIPSRNLGEIRRQLDVLREGLGTIYSLTDVLKNEHAIIGRLNATLRNPTRLSLSQLETTLQALLDHATRLASAGRI